MVEKIKIDKVKHLGQNFTWTSVNGGGEEEIEFLKKNYKFHPLDLEDCLSGIQRPKIDDYDDYLFIVLHVPVRKGRNKQVRTTEINVFIGQNYVITLHEDNQIIEKVFEKCKKNKSSKDEYMGKGSGYFLYMVIDHLFEAGFPLLDDLTKQLNELEKEVFDYDYSKDRLKDILLLKKDIINFRRIIMPQRAIIAQLEHKNKKFLPENLDVYFDDIVDKIEKLWNNLENLQELVVSLHETNESIISHNTNNVIKVLTLFSVVMLPLTFITGFYGMNIDFLPFAEAGNHSFTIITGLIVGVAVSMIIYFKYKKWL